MSAPQSTGNGRDWTGLVVPLIVAAVFIAFYGSLLNAPAVDRVFITPLMIVGTLIWCAVMWGEISKLRLGAVDEDGADQPAPIRHPKKIIGFVALIVVYLLCMEYVGFFVSSFAMLIAGMLWLGARDWKQILAVSIGLIAVEYLLFDKLLEIPFPPSPIGLF